jgi:hypothetical protein
MIMNYGGYLALAIPLTISTEEEMTFAKNLQATLSPEDIQDEISKLPKAIAPYLKDKALSGCH